MPSFFCLCEADVLTFFSGSPKKASPERRGGIRKDDGEVQLSHFSASIKFLRGLTPQSLRTAQRARPLLSASQTFPPHCGGIFPFQGSLYWPSPLGEGVRRKDDGRGNRSQDYGWHYNAKRIYCTITYSKDYFLAVDFSYYECYTDKKITERQVDKMMKKFYTVKSVNVLSVCG